jgi:hypothetical protein
MISGLKFRKTIFVLLLICVQQVCFGQNSECTFDGRYYQVVVPGTDNAAAQNAKKYLVTRIYQDNKDIPRNRFEQIISYPPAIVQFCKTSGSVTAYALKSAVRERLSCPDVTFQFSGPFREDLCQSINNKTQSLFFNLNCSFAQGRPVNFQAISLSSSAENELKELIKCFNLKSQLDHNEQKLVKLSSGLFIADIPVTLGQESNKTIPDKMQILYGESGRIEGFAFNWPLQSALTVPAEMNTTIRKFLSNFFINRESVIKELKRVAFSTSQRNYLSLLETAYRQDPFFGFEFETIEVIKHQNGSDIYDVSIMHGWKLPDGKRVRGNLILYFGNDSDHDLNTFEWL